MATAVEGERAVVRPLPVRARPGPAPGAVAALAAALAVAWAGGSPWWAALRVVGVVAVAVAAHRTLASGRVGSTAVALVLGVVGLAAGLGLAVPHLAKDPLSLRAAAGVVATGAGAVLALRGGRVVVGGAPRRARIPLGALLVVLLALPTWTTAVAVAATNVPPTSDDADGLGAFGLDAWDVGLEVDDGVVLSAWYVPSSNGAAVVLLHGAGSTRSSTLPHAAVLARHGYGVLLLDARGHGDSGGQAMDLGWHGEDDIAVAVRFLRGRPEVEAGRIGAVGLSMGGEEALGALGADIPLAAVVAEGATGRVAADHAWLDETFGWRGRVQQVLERAITATADLLTDASPPRSLRSSVARSDAPVLLVAAGRVGDEGRAARHIASAAPDRVEIWTVGGATHTAGLTTRPAEWERRVVAFLDDALGG